MAQLKRTYGDAPDQIHPFFLEKRTWSRVKDKILGDYVDCYLKTVGRRGRPIIIVDAFAGPGRFGDGSQGSPSIICQAMEKASRRLDVRLACLFADSHPPHREELRANLFPYISTGIAAEPMNDFAGVLSRALEVGAGSTLLFYLDPFGIKDLQFSDVSQIYERNTRQSTEVLINFNFRTFMRMSGNWSYDDSASDVAQRVKEAKVGTVNGVMGGNYWRAIITNPDLSKTQREDAVVEEYLSRVRRFFTYSFAIPVKEQSTAEGVPVDALAKYHLIFGTRSPRAVVYMNDVALNSLRPYFEGFRDGLLFDMTPTRYTASSVGAVKEAIIEALRSRPMTRPQIYEQVIPQFFLQRLRKEYRAILDSLALEDQRVFPNPATLKRPRRLNDETLLSIRPWPAV